MKSMAVSVVCIFAILGIIYAINYLFLSFLSFSYFAQYQDPSCKEYFGGIHSLIRLLWCVPLFYHF